MITVFNVLLDVVLKRIPIIRFQKEKLKAGFF